ncbi:MAG: aspartate/glutamate racemase family protein [Thermodesulfobacteriota bacterium]
MKKIGILGGMAPESTLEFYRQLTSLAQEVLPGRSYPVIIIYSLNMEEFRNPLNSGNYPGAISILSSGIEALSRAGADFAIIASNTPHMFFDELVRSSSIKLLSMVAETAKAAERRGFVRVGLYGTGFTMESSFFKDEFEKYGISVFTPGKEDRNYIHEKAMGELADGKVVESTKQRFIEISRTMIEQEDIQALILGSTELPLILNEEALGIPVLDTTAIIIQAAFNYSQGKPLS